jgi:hypothetical protein
VPPPRLLRNDRLLHLAFEPRPARTLTSLRAIEFTGDRLRYQIRIVSGRATVATSARTLRPGR